jgi:hypothetical protein
MVNRRINICGHKYKPVGLGTVRRVRTTNSNSYVNFRSLNHKFKKLLNNSWSKKCEFSKSSLCFVSIHIKKVTNVIINFIVYIIQSTFLFRGC